jgi:hypothetical protein
VFDCNRGEEASSLFFSDPRNACSHLVCVDWLMATEMQLKRRAQQFYTTTAQHCTRESSSLHLVVEFDEIQMHRLELRFHFIFVIRLLHSFFLKKEKK